MIISHSQDFLNGVCTNIIHMHLKQLKYYGVSFYTSDNYTLLRFDNSVIFYKIQNFSTSRRKGFIDIKN